MLIPRPVDNEPEPQVYEGNGPSYEWVKWFLSRPTWKCTCRVVNHGHNKICAVCKQVPRPSWYIEEVYSNA